MFIAASFVIAKTYKQLKYPEVGEWLNRLIHPYSGKLFTNKKEQSTDIYNSLDGSQRHWALVKDVYLQKLQTVCKHLT